MGWERSRRCPDARRGAECLLRAQAPPSPHVITPTLSKNGRFCCKATIGVPGVAFPQGNVLGQRHSKQLWATGKELTAWALTFRRVFNWPLLNNGTTASFQSVHRRVNYCLSTCWRISRVRDQCFCNFMGSAASLR